MGGGMIRKSLTIYYADEVERQAVKWLKARRHRGGFVAYAIEEVAYSEFHKGRDWRRPPILFSITPRDRFVAWRIKPYGNPDLNRLHMRTLAKREKVAA